jgi:dihydrofolate reductase
MVKICAIAAMAKNRVIGKDNKLPWSIPEDMKMFSQLTKGQTVLMGRKTYESLPENYKPLPGRLNIVITRNPEALLNEVNEKGIKVFASPEQCLENIKNENLKIQGEILWVVGGEQIYRSTLKYCDEIYLTLVDQTSEGDTWFPEFETNFTKVSEDKKDGFSFLKFKKI